MYITQIQSDFHVFKDIFFFFDLKAFLLLVLIDNFKFSFK